MVRKSPAPADLAIFAPLPVGMVTVGRGRLRVAVHQSGDRYLGLPPIICLPGYHRNMADYAAFIKQFRSQTGKEWPMIAIDLPGRGRSTDRLRPVNYSSIVDAAVVAEILSAMGVHQAVFLGQGHGGQVIMALGAQRPTAIRAAILVDAGPVADSRGLVRLRNNLSHLSGLRGSPDVLRTAMEKVVMADFPGLDTNAIAAIAERTHVMGNGRLVPLFDMALVERLQDFGTDDVFEPQWGLFNTLSHADLMLIRTQLTDQLRRETFEEMAKQRSDAVAITLPGQGSPALLETADEAGAIADFIEYALKIG